MKKILIILYATALGMIFDQDISMAQNENSSTVDDESQASSGEEEEDSSLIIKKKKKRKGKKKNKEKRKGKKKNKGKKKRAKESVNEENSADEEDRDSSLSTKKKKDKKRKGKKKGKGKNKKARESVNEENPADEEDRNSSSPPIKKGNDGWKNEQALNFMDEIGIIDPIIDSTQIQGDSIKIETLPITQLAGIEKTNLDRKLLGTLPPFEISKLEISKDVDAKIEKLSEKMKGNLEVRLESAVEMNRLSMPLPERRQRDGKENAKFRKELEKYRQIYAESLKIGSVNV